MSNGKSHTTGSPKGASGAKNGNPTNTEAARAFLNALFGETTGPINLCTLRNNAGGAGSTITSDDSKKLQDFVVKGDVRGWGTYACVSTMLSTKHHHSKEAINEIPSLHIDIDCKDLALDSKDDVIRKLKTLRLPPSILVDSGNGVHAYWRFKEPFKLMLDDRQAVIDRIESALKLLCDLVGGDQKVTQPSAVMRLPGTFNTKMENQNHEVQIIWSDDNRNYRRLAERDLADYLKEDPAGGEDC